MRAGRSSLSAWRPVPSAILGGSRRRFPGGVRWSCLAVLVLVSVPIFVLVLVPRGSCAVPVSFAVSVSVSAVLVCLPPSAACTVGSAGHDVARRASACDGSWWQPGFVVRP